MEAKKRILILHANEQVLIGLEKHFEDSGVDTTTTWDVHQAASLLSNKEFDCLLIEDRPLYLSVLDRADNVAANVIKFRLSSEPCKAFADGLTHSISVVGAA